MSDNKGLNDQDLLQLCRSGEAITSQDIGGMMSQSSNADTNDLTYLSESGMPGLTLMNFSQNENKDDDSEK